MGMTYIVGIRDDAIRDATESREEWERLRAELGESLLTVCLKEVDRRLVFTMMRMQSAAIVRGRVGNHYGALTVSDEVHDTDQRLFLWKGNDLRALDKASEEDLDLAAELIVRERRRRMRIN